MKATAAPDAGLVPLADRLRYMQGFRAIVIVAVLVTWVALPRMRALPLVPLVVVSAVYAASAAGAARAFRRHRSTVIRVFGLTLLADGVYLAIVSYGSAGFGPPLQYLVLLHLVAVTLLASFRSGVKLALWHSLVATAVFQLRSEGQIRHAVAGIPPATATDVALFLAVVWLGTLFTASFAAVNERELRRRNYDLQALARLSWQLEFALSPQEVAEALVEAVATDFDADRVVLLVRSGDRMAPLAGRRFEPVPTGIAPDDDRVLAQCLRERRTLRLAQPVPAEHPWLSKALPDPGNVLTLPLYSDGTPLGVLVLESGQHGARIERRAVEMLERFVSQAALALTNARLLAQVRALAAADGLTGVANRRTFDAQLAAEVDRSVRTGRPLSVILFDVDHFKRLNDTFGHQAGDEALRRVAATLSAAARGVDLVARYGGEEFVVILPETGLAEAAEAAERLRAAVEQVAVEPRVTASLGVATFPGSALDPAGLVAAADEALYAAKQQGRNRVVTSTRIAAASPAMLTASGSGEPTHPAR
jgi:diguanylate cyclase (GGDEF)-like protein